MKPDEDWAAVIMPRRFTFTESSRYKALVTGVRQFEAIGRYEQQNRIPVYYLLYHPCEVPHAVVLPVSGAAQQPIDACDVGCRIVPAKQLHATIAGQPGGYSPAFGELRTSLGPPFTADTHPVGWRLEHFVVDLLLECEVGYIAESANDGGLNYVFNRRTGPISAAIALTIDAPA